MHPLSRSLYQFISKPSTVSSLRTRIPSYNSLRHLTSTNRFYNTSFSTESNLRAAPRTMAQIPKLKLNDGKEIPMLGYGLGTARARMGNKDGSNIDPELVKTVVMAIKQGYHHLDGAEVYGNEAELGQAIIDSGVPREKLFITTKINGTKQQNTLESFNTSLAKLKLDYVDLYLIHAPYFATTPLDLQNKWSEMESILASGKAKSIGVSNFLQPHLETILQTAKVIPAINQIEYHPYLQHGNLVDFHRKHGIVTEAYSPLAAVTKGAPGPLDVVYERLAGKYGVSVGEVALRWTVDRGVVALTTSGKEERLRDYLRICDFRLTDEEVEEIMEVGGRKHFRVFWRGKFGDDDRS